VTPPAPVRHFLGWDAPALERAAEVLLEGAGPRPGDAEREVPREVDLSDTLVVLPGGRAQRLLLERLLEGAEARGVVLRPPEQTTVGRLPERLYTPSRPPPPPEVEGAAWTTAVRELLRDGGEGFLTEPPEPDDLPGWWGVGELLQRLFRELEGEGLTAAGVARRLAVASDLLHDDSPRWRLLSRVEARVAALLAEAGFQGEGAARREALQLGFPPLERRLVLVGVVDLPGVVRSFLERVEARGPVELLVHAPATWAERFDALGCVLADRWEEVPSEIPDQVIRVAGGPGGQADALLQELQALGGTLSAEEITVGTLDQEVTPLLAERLEEAGVAVRVAEGRPLAGTGLHALLESTAAFVDGKDFGAFAALMRHPELEERLRAQGGMGGVDAPAAADLYFTAALPAVLEEGPLPTGGGSRREEELAGRVGALRDALRHILGPLATVRGARPLSRWSAGVRGFLLEIYGGRALQRGAPGDRELLAAATAVEEVLSGFEALPPALDLPATGGTALRLLLARLAGVRIPPGADDAAVELLGRLELPLDDAGALFVVGVNEPHFPASVTADPFLPHALRVWLGMPDNRLRWARDLYHLQAMLHSRRVVRLIAGRRDAAGNPLRLSRLLLNEGPELAARRVLEMLGREPGEGPPLGGGEAASSGPRDGTAGVGSSPGAPSRFLLPPEPEIRAPLPRDALAVTQFRTLLQDPYAWALEQVLGLEVVHDRERELDPLGFGSLAHAVMEELAPQRGVEEMEEVELQRLLLARLELEARRRFGSRPLPAVRVQLAQLRARLVALAAWQAGRNREGWRIAAVEVPRYSREERGTPFPVDDLPFFLRGRIDRIDHHPEGGEWQLLDYKTGERGETPEETHRKGRGAPKGWVDLQLPLYRHLVATLQRPEGGPLLPPGVVPELGYVVLPRDPGEVGERLAEWSADELAEADGVARGVIRFIRENRFAWNPATSRIQAGDHLGPVVGKGALLLGGDEGDEAEEGSDE